MYTPAKGSRILTALAASLLLAGCAGTPAKAPSDEYSVFYEGESSTTYATAFPVGSPEEAYRNGDLAYAAGDYDRALFEYIRGLKLAKEPSPEALYNIGHIHHLQKNYRLADLAYRWTLERAPDHARAGTGLGEVLLHSRHYQAAKEQLLKVTAAHAKAPWQAYNALGIIADMDGKSVDAERYYEEALAVQPNSPTILNNLGYSRYLAGDWDGAKTALQAALRANSGYELAWRNLGLVHARQGDYGFALEALIRSGQPAEAYNDVGFVTMMAGDYPQALSFFEEAMRLSPSYYVTASENAGTARQLLSRHGRQ